LRIYLNDHRAGAAAGITTARRSARHNRGSALGATLEQLVSELEADARTLDHVIRELQLATNTAKRAVASSLAALGELKSNGRLFGYSPLSRLLELELLLAGIGAKRALWRALQVTIRDRLPDVDLDELLRRADSQRASLVPHHEMAAAVALLDEAT
jgi:hypothetical protein